MANEYLKRTPTSTGNRRVFTWAGWVKQSAVDRMVLFGSRQSAGGYTLFRTDGTNTRLEIVSDTASTVDGVFEGSRRDVSSWYHIVISIDTTKEDDADRINFYVNGVKLDYFGTQPTAPKNTQYHINEIRQQVLGVNTGFAEYWKGEMADVFLVDGQALTPDVFGFYKEGKGYISAGSTQATDFRPGQWVPKTPRVIKAQIERNGGFGVNGFYLPMNDSSNFGADFHTTPNSIITLKGEDLPQPRNGAPTTTDAYVSQLREDPYADNLVLALPFVSSGLCTNGTNSGINTGFGDYSHIIRGSGSSKVATLIASPTIVNVATGETSGVYYGSGAKFVSSSSQFLTTPFSAGGDFDFGSGDFTVEGWFNPLSASRAGIIAGNNGSQTTSALIPFQIETTPSSGNILFLLGNGSSAFTLGGNSVGVNTTNQWYHFAAVRKGSTATLYLNGVSVGISTNVSGSLATSGITAVYVGQLGFNSGYFNGYLQDLRIYKGVAKYTGGFDVPKPYTPVGIATWRAVPDTTANNFATLNAVDKGSNITISDGNLTYSQGNTTDNTVKCTIGISTGKWYAEARVGTTGKSTLGIAVGLATLGSYLGSDVYGWSYYTNNGNKYNNGSGTAYGSTYTTGDIIGIALNVTDGNLTFYKNGVSQGVAFSGLTTGPYFFSHGANNADGSFNFGQNPTFSGNVAAAGTFTDSNGKGLFKYQPPSGFLALCEDNLPTPAIKNPGEYFKSVLYTGDGNSGRNIVGVGFTPDLVWVKSRSNAYNHLLNDSVRGATRDLFSDLTNAEAESGGSRISSFNSDGFSIGSAAGLNGSGTTNVAWCWRAGAGTTSTNTDGSIQSVVSVNQDAGFSIVSYTGNETAGATIGHGLGKTPGFIIFKSRETALNWGTYHKSLGATQRVLLNSTAAVNDANAFNNTGPTSSIITLGASDAYNDDKKMIAYCWAEIEGFSKFGSYVGNGNADGPFIYTGGRPAFVMFKRTDTTGDWIIMDSSRESVNPNSKWQLYPNGSFVEEDGSSRYVDFLSNGFKIRNSGTGTNASGGTYVYACFMESPFTTANSK